MDLVFDGFAWDEGNSAKCESHGVSIAEIETVFLNRPLVAPDMAQSVDEQRRIAIGRNREGRPILVAFTVRERSGRR